MRNGYFLKHLSGTLIFFLVLFISAGRIDYWQGWIYLIISLIMFTLGYTLLKPSPDLLTERDKPGEGAKQWDKIILGLSFLFSLVLYIIAGLDSGRYHWSPDFSKGILIAGILLTAAGQLIFLVAQKQNKFFSSTIRVQKERKHTVCDTGLYKVIRHPAYSGSIVQSSGFILLIGSLWCLIPATALIMLTIVRTYKEDKILLDELKGYREYSAKTRFRLIPFIW